MGKWLRELDDQTFTNLAALSFWFACTIAVVGVAVVFVGWLARMAWGG